MIYAAIATANKPTTAPAIIPPVAPLERPLFGEEDASEVAEVMGELVGSGVMLNIDDVAVIEAVAIATEVADTPA
jgi:hypothetical protein